MNAFPCIKNKMFSAYIADNQTRGIHRTGYNGIAALIPHDRGNNLFVPSYAGLNYETISLSGLEPYATVSGGFKFEPRKEPMHIEKVSDNSVTLVQPETSHAHVSAKITFTVEEPHYLHQRIAITAHRRFCPENEKNIFRSLWASYMHMPPDRHIYFNPDINAPENNPWLALTRADHGAPDYQIARLPHNPNRSAPEHLLAVTANPYISPGERSTPLPGMAQTPLVFYYGLCHDLLFLMMFKQSTLFRLAYSPNGGGKEPNWSPAWDYVLACDDMALNTPYIWDLCLIVKPFQNQTDVIDVVQRYINK